uniref:Uncharacterized protein n=1 Tax=Lotus japonicus TaxID=34305 RepID=I3S548_LOTJA|nr:unknown [Lotus japonicus]
MVEMSNSEKQPQPHIAFPIVLDIPVTKTQSHNHNKSQIHVQYSLSPILPQIHAGYFRISLSLSSQALLWKILIEQIKDALALRKIFSSIPSTAFTLLWYLALFSLLGAFCDSVSEVTRV